MIEFLNMKSYLIYKWTMDFGATFAEHIAYYCDIMKTILNLHWPGWNSNSIRPCPDHRLTFGNCIISKATFTLQCGRIGDITSRFSEEIKWDVLIHPLFEHFLVHLWSPFPVKANTTIFTDDLFTSWGNYCIEHMLSFNIEQTNLPVQSRNHTNDHQTIAKQ